MQQDFRSEQLTHAALVQYYRWYQVYEVPFSKRTIQNHKGILAEDIEIVTHASTTKGKDGLEERLKVYEGWLNAHHVKEVEVKQLSATELSLEADIVYQNIRPDGDRYCYMIHYSTELQLRDDVLPVFTKLTLIPLIKIQEFTFQSAYIENRSKSLMYYWFYLIEILPQKVEKFTELLAEDFSIQLVDGTFLKSQNDVRTYFESVLTKIKTGIHSFSEIHITEIEEDVFSVSMKVSWKGFSKDGEELTRDTRHDWLLENNKDDRFARIKKMVITLI